VPGVGRGINSVSARLADSLPFECGDGCVTTSAGAGPVVTLRKERGLEIFEREQRLRARQSAFDRERTRAFTETGQKVRGQGLRVSEEERAVRGELRALGAQRSRLLEEIAAREAELRPMLADFGKARQATPASRAGQQEAARHHAR
jgi:hypothetical protein